MPCILDKIADFFGLGKPGPTASSASLSYHEPTQTEYAADIIEHFMNERLIRSPAELSEDTYRYFDLDPSSNKWIRTLAAKVWAEYLETLAANPTNRKILEKKR